MEKKGSDVNNENSLLVEKKSKSQFENRLRETRKNMQALALRHTG